MFAALPCSHSAAEAEQAGRVYASFVQGFKSGLEAPSRGAEQTEGHGDAIQLPLLVSRKGEEQANTHTLDQDEALANDVKSQSEEPQQVSEPPSVGATATAASVAACSQGRVPSPAGGGKERGAEPEQGPMPKAPEEFHPTAVVGYGCEVSTAAAASLASSPTGAKVCGRPRHHVLEDDDDDGDYWFLGSAGVASTALQGAAGAAKGKGLPPGDWPFGASLGLVPDFPDLTGGEPASPRQQLLDEGLVTEAQKRRADFESAGPSDRAAGCPGCLTLAQPGATTEHAVPDADPPFDQGYLEMPKLEIVQTPIQNAFAALPAVDDDEDDNEEKETADLSSTKCGHPGRPPDAASGRPGPPHKHEPKEVSIERMDQLMTEFLAGRSQLRKPLAAMAEKLQSSHPAEVKALMEKGAAFIASQHGKEAARACTAQGRLGKAGRARRAGRDNGSL